MKVFVSYKWEDPDHNAWVERLARDLRSMGIEALLDKWEVRYGESFSEYMTRGIQTADASLFIMTPQSISAAEAATSGGGAVKFEVQLATARRIAGEDFRFIGILRSGDRAAVHLRDFRYADFRDDTAYQTSLQQLVSDLLGCNEKPPVQLTPSDYGVVEVGSVGQDLGTGSLCGEFIVGTSDLIVWEESTDGPSAPIGLYKANITSYNFTPIESILFATRIHSGPGGWIIATQEREGIHVFDLTGRKTAKFLSIHDVGEPIIRSEAQHHDLPIVAVGTDYGKVVLWNWQRNKVIFSKRYFPREQIVWISGLAFSASGDMLAFCVNNSLYCVSTKNGDLLSEQKLGTSEETTNIAINRLNGRVAVGGVMDTKVYKSVREHSNIYQVQNMGPLVWELRFSHDGSLLGIVSGGFGASGVTLVDSIQGNVLQRFAQVWPPSKANQTFFGFPAKNRISFSDAAGLIAVGEGGRVGIYKRGRE